MNSGDNFTSPEDSAIQPDYITPTVLTAVASGDIHSPNSLQHVWENLLIEVETHLANRRSPDSLELLHPRPISLRARFDDNWQPRLAAENVNVEAQSGDIADPEEAAAPLQDLSSEISLDDLWPATHHQPVINPVDQNYLAENSSDESDGPPPLVSDTDTSSDTESLDSGSTLSTPGTWSATPHESSESDSRTFAQISLAALYIRVLHQQRNSTGQH